MTVDKKRLKYISYIQIIGIILVVLGHSFHEYPDGAMGMNTLVYRMMFSFRMPLFMFASGFLLVFTTNNRSRTWSNFVASKTKRLMIPFIVMALLLFIPRTMASGLADDSFELSWHSFLTSILWGRHLVIPYYWFLQSSFTLLVVIYGVICVANNFKIAPSVYYTLLMSVVLTLNLLPISYTTFFSFDRTVELSAFFILGCIYAQWNTKINSMFKSDNLLAIIALLVLWASSFFVLYNTGYLQSLICSAFGIAMVIAVALYMEKKNITILDHLIGTNYIIFLLSWFPNIAAQQVLSHYVALPWWIHSILSLLLGVYMPWMVYKMLQRYNDSTAVNAISFLLGQSIGRREPSQLISAKA